MSRSSGNRCGKKTEAAFTLISGGQTGVDRAALDVAIDMEIPCCGWCPCGRRAEDGRIPDIYPLRETVDARYSVRTRWNVRDSDGTLILTVGRLKGGTALTERYAISLGRPYIILDPSSEPRTADFSRWIDLHGIAILNVAGPRESSIPGIYQTSRSYLKKILKIYLACDMKN